MKKISVLIAALWACCSLNAQLIVYSNYNQQGSSGTCVARTVYTDASIPNSLNNGIKSISLNQGFMATLAENADGSGESFCYMANVSNLTVNLALVLQNKVSFIRVLPLPSTTVKKKGAGAVNNAERDALNVSWFYDWGIGDVSTTTQSYTPMLWGAYSGIETSVNTVVSKTNVTHFLSFNEPDSRGQSGGSGGGMADNATLGIPYYKKMLRSGMRMGSPATTESQYRVWLTDFTTEAALQNLRIDYVAVHWYDWGNVCTNFTGCDLTMPIAGKTVDMNATNIFNRFKSHINAVYALHQKPIWITEFNAHPLRSDAVHAAFMALALPWLDANPNVERYAYFFGNDAPARNADGSLTAAGQAYSNHASVNAYPANIFDDRPVYPDIASWETSAQLTGGSGVANFAPTYLDANLTAPSGLTRGSGASLSSLVTNGYWGASAWSTTTAAAGVTANKFLTLSLKSTNGKAVSYTSFDKFKIRIANTGPIKYQIDYKIDNGAYSPCATVTGPTATTGDYSLGPIDLSGISSLQDVPPSKTVTFRITPFNASGTGVFYFGASATDTEADLSVAGFFTESLLPITLSDFQSNRVKNKIFLKWETKSEVNFSHFVLERSMDGKAFYALAKINASKMSNGSTYAYTDTPDAAATHYYRLKMVDADGSFVYSKILSEGFDEANAPLLVYPSIATQNRIDVTFKKVSDAAQIKIFNTMGQLMRSYNLEAEQAQKPSKLPILLRGPIF